MQVQMCGFTERQYKADFHGTRVTPEQVEQLTELAKEPYEVIPGYADFCCIVVLKNKQDDGTHLFPELQSLTIEREKARELGAELRCAYEARNENEVAVLVDWVEGIEPVTADWIHLILYSREQMAKENDVVEADWAIVSINAATTQAVEPMRPITSMRNALGVEEGGSGVKIDREAYNESVAFWQKYAMIRRS